MTSIQEKIIKPKLGLLELAKQLGSVSQACKVMGYSRDSFYRFKKPLRIFVHLWDFIDLVIGFVPLTFQRTQSV